jgi:hypothetical protein
LAFSFFVLPPHQQNSFPFLFPLFLPPLTLMHIPTNKPPRTLTSRRRRSIPSSEVGKAALSSQEYYIGTYLPTPSNSASHYLSRPRPRPPFSLSRRKDCTSHKELARWYRVSMSRGTSSCYHSHDWYPQTHNSYDGGFYFHASMKGFSVHPFLHLNSSIN